MAVTRPNINFSTKQIVFQEATTKPYVGFENINDLPLGWEFDIKRWSSLFDLRLPVLPNLADASTQGVSESEYFQSGVGLTTNGDLLVESIYELFLDHQRRWIPIVRTGDYYRYKTPWFLYGDNSRIQYLKTEDNRDERNYLLLDKEPDLGTPILASSFTRGGKFRIPAHNTLVNQRHDFSGVYVDGVEQQTLSPLGKVEWDNVDFNKKEFIVDSFIEGQTSLLFNKNYIETIGVVPEVFQDLAACELLGMSDGSSYQVFYLKNFPVLADDSFHLYIASTSTWEEWTRVDDWFTFINSTSDKSFFLDRDLGIVYFGSASSGGNPSIGKFIVASYSTTIRVEYEEVDHEQKVTAWDADTSPVSQYINQGFVCITHDQLEAASIKLEIDKPLIPFTYDPREYGPVTIGSDYAVLKGTVTSASGVKVPGVEVGFEMSPSNLGYLDGSSSSSSVTNGNGEAYTSYQPPVSADNLGYYTVTMRASTHPSYTAHKDLILKVNDTGLKNREEDVYLYQVLKDDVILAYDNLDDWIYENITPPSWVVDAEDYNKWKEEFVIENDIKDWHTQNTASGIKPDGSIDGRKVVVYKITPSTDNYDSEAINPVTGELGAVVPVRPVLVEKIEDDLDEYNGFWRVIYPEDAVPDCDPTDSGNNIGGYWVVSTRLVTFKAHCWSPYYNRIIYSNEVNARISLPPYLLGEYITESLEKIPFGWKILTDTDNIAAGVDGATFVTINPFSGPYKIIDLVNGTDSDEWFSAPFKSLGFQIEIKES